jgi:hypothetical protein
LAADGGGRRSGTAAFAQRQSEAEGCRRRGTASVWRLGAVVVVAIAGTTVGARVVVVVVAVVLSVGSGLDVGQRVGGAKRQMAVL